MRIRLAREADLHGLIALSESCSDAAHWTEAQWLTIFRTDSPRRLAWVAEREEDAQLAAFLVALDGHEDWELENIAVHPNFRRLGLARALILELIAAASGESAERILLEVRASNQAAVSLYNLSGFSLLAKRRDYYQNPSEDALILVRSLVS